MSNTFCGWTEPHDPHSWGTGGIAGDINWCLGWIEPDREPRGRDNSLLEALGEAERANNHSGRCGMCDALGGMSEAARDGVNRALSGTIGAAKLSSVLTANGYPVAERQIRKHRREAHTP